MKGNMGIQEFRCKLLRLFRSLQWVGYGLLAIGSVSPALGQTYYFSAPISGWSEVDLSFGGGSSGGMVTTFGTLNETLFYDPSAQTLRQVGSISLSPISGSFTIEGGPFFPSGLAGAANLTIGSGTGALAFDTGTQSAGPGTGQYDWSLTLPVSGFCTVVNNGQTNSGTVNYSVELDLATTVVSASPTNLFISESATAGAIGADRVADVGGVDLYDGTEDNTYYYSWKLNPISATPAPEPGPLSLLGFGVVVMALRLKQTEAFVESRFRFQRFKFGSGLHSAWTMMSTRPPAFSSHENGIRH